MTRDELVERMARAAEALHGPIGPSASCDYDQIMRAALTELEKHVPVQRILNGELVPMELSDVEMAAKASAIAVAARPR